MDGDAPCRRRGGLDEEDSMTCAICAKEAVASKMYFCYWCGQPVCADCVLFVLLPLKTEATVCPSCQHENGKNEAADESMWEITVNATLMGHNLGAWEITERGDGWQVRCRTCGGTAWVSVSGLQYSLLPDRCSGFDNLTAHK